jgi:hypothetical protein
MSSEFGLKGVEISGYGLILVLCSGVTEKIMKKVMRTYPRTEIGTWHQRHSTAVFGTEITCT